MSDSQYRSEESEVVDLPCAVTLSEEYDVTVDDVMIDEGIVDTEGSTVGGSSATHGALTDMYTHLYTIRTTRSRLTISIIYQLTFSNNIYWMNNLI